MHGFESMVDLTRYREDVVVNCLKEQEFSLMVDMMRDMQAALLAVEIYATKSNHTAAKNLVTACKSTNESIKNLNNECITAAAQRIAPQWQKGKIYSLVRPISAGIELCIRLHKDILATDPTIANAIIIFPEDFLMPFWNAVLEDRFADVEKMVMITSGQLTMLRAEAYRKGDDDAAKLITRLTQMSGILNHELLNGARALGNSFKSFDQQHLSQLVDATAFLIDEIHTLSRKVLGHI